MEYSEFTESIAVMQAVFGRTLPESTVAYYWSRYKDTQPGKFKAAATKLVDTFIPTAQVPFPLPAHINGAMGNMGREVSVRVLALVKEAIVRADSYISVSFNDPALHSVISRFGGWIAICGWNDHDWQIQEGRFIEAYQSALAAGDKGPAYFPGSHEIHNASHGFDDDVPKVMVFDRSTFITTGRITTSEIHQKQLIGNTHGQTVRLAGPKTGSEPEKLWEIL